MTPGEKELWRKLRSKKLHGLKFRRQVPIGSYIVDFLCPEKKLIIEIDGDSHFQPGAKEKDDVREAYLRDAEFHMLRFSNHYTCECTDAVLEQIGAYLGYSSDEPPPLSPLPPGGED